MSEMKHLDGPEAVAKIAALIKDIHICMLTTINDDGTLDSRPMATQKSEFDGTVWFLCKQHSGKVSEIRHDAHVGLVYSDPSGKNFVTAKGKAEVSQDKGKIKELWNPMFKAWFPEGEDDPEITVIKVVLDEAQYWEASGSKIVYGLKYLAAAVTGGKVDVGETGKARL